MRVTLSRALANETKEGDWGSQNASPIFLTLLNPGLQCPLHHSLCGWPSWCSAVHKTCGSVDYVTITSHMLRDQFEDIKNHVVRWEKSHYHRDDVWFQNPHTHVHTYWKNTQRTYTIILTLVIFEKWKYIFFPASFSYLFKKWLHITSEIK